MEKSSPSKFWFLPLLTGIVFIVGGIWIFTTPESSFIALSMLFAATFFVNGIFEIFRAFGNSQRKNWVWGLVFGIVDFVFGIWLLSSAALSATILSLYVGFIILFRSISSIGFSMDLKEMGASSWIMPLVFGILGVLLGAMILFNPAIGGAAIVIYIALAFIFIGFFQVTLAFALRKLQ